MDNIKEVNTHFNGDVKFLSIFCFDILAILKKELEHLTQGRQDIFMCLAALLCEQVLSIREWVGSAKISIKSYFMEIIFFSQCIQQQGSFLTSEKKLRLCCCFIKAL